MAQHDDTWPAFGGSTGPSLGFRVGTLKGTPNVQVYK